MFDTDDCLSPARLTVIEQDNITWVNVGKTGIKTNIFVCGPTPTLFPTPCLSDGDSLIPCHASTLI